MTNVFVRVEPGLKALRHAKSKNMLRIMRNTFCVAMTPVLVDREPMRDFPVDKLFNGHAEPGFFGDLTYAYGSQRLVESCLAAGDRLPEPRVIRTLDD